MFLCNVSGFWYNAFLLHTNIDRDYGSFLDFGHIVEVIHPIIFGLDFFFSLKLKGKKKPDV